MALPPYDIITNTHCNVVSDECSYYDLGSRIYSEHRIYYYPH